MNSWTILVLPDRREFQTANCSYWLIFIMWLNSVKISHKYTKKVRLEFGLLIILFCYLINEGETIYFVLSNSVGRTSN